MKYLFVFVLGLFLFFVCLGIKNNDASDLKIKITGEEAIRLAKGKIKSFGYDSENMAVKVSSHNQPWNPYVPENSTDEYDLIRKDKLTGKKYWAVYYYWTNPLRKGGDVCIFVDADTGKIITECRWK